MRVPNAPVVGEPTKVSESFLRHVVAATTSYSEGWRELAARTLWLEAEVARLRAAETPDPTQAEDPHVDRLVELITRSLAAGGCSNCGGVPHTTTCRVGRLASAFESAPRPTTRGAGW